MARLTGRGSRVAGRGSRIICRGCGIDVADAGRKSRVENYFARNIKLEFEVND